MVLAAVLIAAAGAATDVWLDVDPAAGLFERDVDDVLAMIQAFHSPEIEVHGVSVVFGNSPLDKGEPIAREVSRRFHSAELPVHAGAATEEQLGEVTPAVVAMRDALAERRLTILALGPLTNVGTLVMKFPDLVERIDSMVIVAGRRPGQKFTYYEAPEAGFPDANFEHDPAAMQALLDSGVRIVMAPWEVSSHVWIAQEDLDWLSTRSESGAYIAEKSTSWIGMWKRRFDLPGFNPFDTLAVAWVTHPELIESMPVVAKIVEGDNDRAGTGQPARKPFLLVKETADAGAPLTYCYRPKDEVQALIRSRLAGPEDGSEP